MIDFEHALPTKTELGRQEIETRALRLPPLLRRLLLLVDGKRPASELGGFVAGQDVQAMLTELTERGCVEWLEATPRTAPAKPAAVPRPEAEHPELAKLPPPESRDAKQVEMARNFMINTVNTMHPQYTRLTLVEHISDCTGAVELRHQFGAWKQAMLDSSIGSRRLPELTEKLLAVL